MSISRKNFARFLLSAFTCISLAFSFSISAGDEQKTKIRFLPQWSVQSQFAGYYMAQKKGIYSKHGLDVEIIPGGPDAPAYDSLKSGKADIITLFLATGIKERSNGSPIINIGQVSKHSALMMIARKSSGIRDVKDINGKKLALWRSDFQDIPLAFLAESGVSAKIVPISSSINLFLSGGTDLMTVMWYNEYHAVLNSGLNPDELTEFQFSKLDFDVPEDGLYCLEEKYRANPKAFRSFVDASLEGWKYAFENQEETVDTVMDEMKKQHIPANRSHQTWMLARMRDLIMNKTGLPLSSELDEKSYAKTAGLLKKTVKISKVPPYGEFFVGAADKPQGSDRK